MKALTTIVLLVISNTFMTFAWYGHLKFKEMSWFNNLGLVGIIFISWGIALFEYSFQVPANRIGSVSYTHLRAHETVLDLVCRLLLATKTSKKPKTSVLILRHSTYINSHHSQQSHRYSTQN